jgi:hypothetical protein
MIVGVMDQFAIAQLGARWAEMVDSAQAYRSSAETDEVNRDFYRALAVTYERSAREMKLMLDKTRRLSGSTGIAA